MTRHHSISKLATLLLAALAAGCAHHAASTVPAVPAVPAVPESLAVPAAQVLTLAAHGAGFQIYECQPSRSDTTMFAWTLKGPEARLHDQSGMDLGRHYAGPTWETKDGSGVGGSETRVAYSADYYFYAARP